MPSIPKSRNKERKNSEKKNEPIGDIDEEIMGEIAAIKVGREELSRIIIKRAQEELKIFGIELVDVQLRRISYVESVQQKVYQRMISERLRIAEKIKIDR